MGEAFISFRERGAGGATPEGVRVAAPFWHGWLVGLVAALAVLVFVVDTHEGLAFRIPTVDAATYQHQARRIAEGGAAPREAFWQPPLYPHALALMYGLGVEGMLPVRLAHGVPLVAAAVLTWFLARRLVAVPWLALAAGLAVALYGPLLFYGTQLLPAGLATVLTMLAVMAVLWMLEQPSPPRAALSGGVFGVAALATPHVLVCALAPLVVLGRRASAGGLQERRAALQVAGALLAGVALVILPVTVRNRVVSGDWVLISTNGGINLYLGNNADMNQTLSARPGQDWDRLTSWPYRHGAQSAAEAERFFYQEVARFAVESPLKFVGGLLRKTGLLLGGRELPRNVDLYDFREWSWMLSALVWRVPGFNFPFGLLAPLALLGLWPAWRQGWQGRMLVALVGLYAVTLVLFFPAARYRVPLVPPLAVLAAMGAWGCWRAWREGRHGAAGLALAAALLVVNWPRQNPMAGVNFSAELRTNLGVSLQVRRQAEAALAQYDKALEMDPEYADAHYFRGTLLRDVGRREEARLEFQAALASRPNHEKALHDLAVLHYDNGQVEKAAALLRRALAVNPRYVRAMQNLALAEVRLGHPEKAQELLKRAHAVSAPGADAVP